MNLQLLSFAIGSGGGVNITEKTFIYHIPGIVGMTLDKERETIVGHNKLVLTEYQDGRLRVRAQSNQCGFLATMTELAEVEMALVGPMLTLRGDDFSAAVIW